MTTMRQLLPLYSVSNYFYIVPLEGISYELWLYYNERMEQWIFNLSTAEGDPIILGESLVPEFPIILDYLIPNLSGYFWLEPIGKKQNETVINPFELSKYYTLSYIYEDENT